MTGTTWEWIGLASAVASGLAGGTTYAFSSFVMRGLGALDAPQSIRAMQAINVAAIGPAFLALFMGTGLATTALGIVSFWGPGGAARAWYLAGAALYLFGVVVVTVAGNVPLNDALARLQATPATAPADWAGYTRPWLALNHLRTAAAALAAGAFVLSALAA